ncbi:MAG: DUF2478 domain-containing protein [Bacteroidales bacterium]|nr:DUF2478 domain-containing protein [Bacteroidales bacterium]
MTGSLNNTWTKAAVIGSVWAAFEVIVGSFLHNLRIPFAGMLLASASVFLLVAYLQLWREKGLIIRAGIICALMKSISPSAIILGPMVGIFMEALLIELSLLLLGRHLVAYLIGGALAVSWALFHKVFSLLLLYGNDLVAIAAAFYAYLVKLSGLKAIAPAMLLGIILGIYLLLGMIAALGGYRAGKKFIGKPGQQGAYLKLHTSEVDESIGKAGRSVYSVANLLMVLVTVVSSLALINFGYKIAGLLIGTAFIGYSLQHYKQSVRHLKKASLWIQFLLITLVAAMLWDWVSTGTYFSLTGLRIGLEMNFRAMVMIFGFSAISIELRNPVIKSLLFRHGFSRLYQALGLSFSALPAIIENLPKPASLKQEWKLIVDSLLNQSVILLRQFDRLDARFNPIIVTGEVHQGKTSFVMKALALLEAENLQVHGFLSTGTFSNGRREQYDLLDLQSGASLPLASASQQNGWTPFRRFFFNPKAFEFGIRLIGSAIEQQAKLVVVDEVGPMEMDRKGWYTGLEQLMQHDDILQIWVVRKSMIETLKAAWKVENALVIDMDTYSPEMLASEVFMGLSSNRGDKLQAMDD